MAIQNAGELVPLAEAAERCHVRYLTAWKWYKRGRFPRAVRKALGASVRVFVPAEDVEVLASSREGHHVSR